jgi:hypothetical protein
MKKRIAFVILVYLGCIPLFGQQVLWTTAELLPYNTLRISMNQVKAEILKFADLYDFYSDMSGYSFDTDPSGKGLLFRLELQLNGNRSFANAIKGRLDVLGGSQVVVFIAFSHRQGIDYLVFHDGGVTGGMSTSNRRRLELLIDQLIANCR